MNAWVLLWDEFRWKLDVLGGLGTCLGLILDDASLIWKNCFCLCSCMRGLRSVYEACILVYATLFLCTQVRSWGSVYVGMDLCTRGLVCMHRLWPTYVKRLAKALLFPFLLLFHLFHLHMQFTCTFLSFLHPNINVSSFLSPLMHHNTIFLKFHLNYESNNIFFAIIIPLC